MLRVATVAAFVVLVTACGGGAGEGSLAGYDLTNRQLSERGGGDTTRLVVGSKDFAEQEILAQITLLALGTAGAEVVDRSGVGSTEAVREALTTEEIDMYWEYTGTGALILLAQADPPTDPQELYADVARTDLRNNGIEWLEPAPADNTYALAVRADAGPEVSEVTTISDLSSLVRRNPDQATICVGPEFSERADGLPGLQEHYGVEFPATNVFVLPDSTVYAAVEQGGTCNFGSVFATSGYIPELDLRLLEDDERFFVAYNPSLTMRAETLQKYPDLEPMFADISERLDTATLRDLSARVQTEQETPEDVAAEWMAEQGLVE